MPLPQQPTSPVLELAGGGCTSNLAQSTKAGGAVDPACAPIGGATARLNFAQFARAGGATVPPRKPEAQVHAETSPRLREPEAQPCLLGAARRRNCTHTHTAPTLRQVESQLCSPSQQSDAHLHAQTSSCFREHEAQQIPPSANQRFNCALKLHSVCECKRSNCTLVHAG